MSKKGHVSRTRTTRGRPSGRPPENRPLPESADSSPAITDATAKRGTSTRIVRRGSRKRQYPTADASRYEPVPGRSLEWLSIRCPYCAGVHLGRLRPGTEPGGPRRTPCGMVFVVVRRTYSPSADAASGVAA